MTNRGRETITNVLSVDIYGIAVKINYVPKMYMETSGNLNQNPTYIWVPDVKLKVAGLIFQKLN